MQTFTATPESGSQLLKLENQVVATRHSFFVQSHEGDIFRLGIDEGGVAMVVNVEEFGFLCFFR